MGTNATLPLTAAGWLLIGCTTQAGPRGDGPADGGIDGVGQTSGTGGVNDASTDGSQGDGTVGDSTDAADSDTDGGGTTGEGDDSTGEPAIDTGEAALAYLSIDPPESIVELDLGHAKAIDFIVTGHYDNGDEIDVTDLVDSWEVENPSLGAFDGARFKLGAFGDATFASTIVTATVDGEQGQAQITVAAYSQSGPTQDFFFVLPYDDPTGPQDKPLAFSTDVKALDVFFNMDTTGSMRGPINNLQSSLVSTVIPEIEAEIADSWFGAGHFEDFPVPTYGWDMCTHTGREDQPFTLLQEITNSAASVQDAVNAMSMGAGGSPIGCGYDLPESNIEALYQIATGEGLLAPGVTNVPANAVGVGGVAFRDGTMPVIVSITDAMSQENASMCSGASYTTAPGIAAVAHDRKQMYAALDNICARVVPVAVGNFNESCGPLADGREFATKSGAIIPPQAWDELADGRPAGCDKGECCTGIAGTGVATDADGMCPLVYRGSSSGTGLDGSIVDGVQMLARYAPFTVTTEVDGVEQDQQGVATPAGRSTADFITAVTPAGHGPVPVGGVPDPTLTATTFEGVVPDTDVSFSVQAHNDFIPQSSKARLFVATIRVLADGCSDLDERDVFILVPPMDLPAPG